MKITKNQLKRMIRESTYEDWRDDISIADDWRGDLSNTQKEYDKLRSPKGYRIGISWELGIPIWARYAKSTFMKRYGNRAGATVRIVRDRKDPPLTGHITVNGIKALDLSDLSHIEKSPRELADLLKKTMDESLKDPERMAQYKSHLNSNRGPGMVMASARSGGSKMKITEAQLRRIIRESILLEQPASQVDEIIAWAKTPGNRVDVDGKVAYAGVKPELGFDITPYAASDYAKKGPAFEKMIRSLPAGSKITLKQYGFKRSGGGSWKSHKTMYIGGAKPKSQPKLNTRRMHDILDITAGVQPEDIRSVNPYPGTDSPFPGQSWIVETFGGSMFLFPSGRNNKAEFAEKTDMHGRPSDSWQITAINLR